MKNKWSAIIVVICFLLTIAVLYVGPGRTVAEDDIITVDDDRKQCPTADYTQFQDAVNAAEEGDTIVVYSGEYRNRGHTGFFKPLTIPKSLTIKGVNDTEKPLLRFPMLVRTDNITVSNLHIYCDDYHGGIDISNSKDVNISCNIIRNIADMGDGVQLTNASHVTIYNNTIKNCCGFGIHMVKSDNNVVKKNLVYSNGGYGTSIGDDKNRTGVLSGVRLTYSHHNLVLENKISYNEPKGVTLKSSDNNTLYRNIINGSRYGLYLNKYSNENMIFHNRLNSTWRWNSTNYTAFDADGNIWFSKKLKEGNHWGDYNGTDSNDDGIGDTTYSISGGNNKDVYPLMKPYTGGIGGKKDGDTSDNGTPGFELLFVFLAIMVVSILLFKLREKVE